MSGLKKSFVLKLISVIVVNAFCVTQAGFAAPYNFGRNLRPVSRVEQAKRAADGKSAGAAGLEGELRLASSTGLTGAPAFVLLKVAKDITERVVDVISMPDSTSLSSNGIGIPIFSTDISLQGPAGFVVSGINFPDGTIKLFPEHIIFDDEKRSFYEKMLQKMANGKFLTPVEASIVSDIEKLKSEPPIELFSMIERQDAASYLALMAAMQKGYLCAHRSDALSMAPIRKPIHGFTEITHQTIFPIFDIVTKMTLENIFSEHSVVYMANDRDIQIKDDGTGTITFYRCVGGILQEDSPVVVSLTPREVDSIKKYFEEESSIQAAKETYKKKETQTPGNLRRWKEAEQNRTGLRRKTLADIARAHIGENIIFVNNLLDDYLGGIDALKRYFELTKGLLRLDQYERIFRNYHEQRPRLIELTRTLHSIIQEEEAAFMVEYKQRIKSQSELAAVRSSLDYLKDIAQTIEKEVLRNIEKALYLGNLDKADRAVLKDLPNSTIRELQSLVSVLNSIDKRMEIRGRDSLGLACEFTFATEQDYRAFLTSLPKDEKDSFDSRAVEEKTEYAKYPYNDLKNYTIKVKRGYNEKGEVDTTKPVVVTMVYKTAVLVGRLGDNVYQIINFIKEDPIIQRLLRDGESIKVIHARWASVGIISEENCHPVSNEGQYSVEINGDVGEYEAILDIPCSKMAKRYGRNGHIFAVLNGDIDNNDRYVLSGLRYYPNLQAAYIENLKRRISSKITTDTKAIPLRVEAYLARGYELEEAFRMAVSDFSGSYSIQMTSDLEPDKIFLALNGDGQGLYIGISQDGFHPASEIYGFIENTQRFLKVKPGQMLVIDRRLSPELTNLRRVIFERDGKPVSEPLTVEDDDIEETVLTSRDIDIRGFPHFFLKEVCETPDMLETTMEGRISVEHDSNGKRALIQLKEEELPPEIEDKIADGRIKEIRVIAMGTAEAACQVIAEKMRSSLKQTEKGRYISVAAEYATDTGFFTMKEDMSDTLVIAVSQSGTTKDTNSSLTEALKRGCSVIAIPNKRDTDLSFLSRDASGGVFYTGSGRDAEIAVASTKAYYAQICAGYILAMRFAQRLGIADEKLVSNIEEMYAIPAKMREFLQPFIPPLSHNFDTEEDYIQAMSEYKTKLEKHPLVRAANYWTLRKPNMEITGDGSNRAAAKEAQIKYQELTYSTVPHESGPEIIHENLSAEPLILLLAANTRGVGDRWLQDALSGVMKKWLAHNAAVVAVATQKELDTCDILKHGKNAYHNKALGTKEERPIDVIIVPETLEDFAPFFTVLAGHLYSYYAALSINDLAVRIGSATDKIISAWDKIRKGQEEGLEDIDIIGNQTFHRAAKVAFRDTRDYIFLRDLNMPGINAGVIIRYGALRDVLKGIIPFTVENIEDKFGKVMTATEIFEEFVRISEVLRLELTRTIDSIRHQAKTVTVGVESGREKEIEQVRHLVDGLQEHDNINQELIRASVEALGHYLKEGTYGVRAIDDTYQDGISYIITVGKDQPGMLYRITETIAEEGLNIHPEMNITSTSVFAESGEKVDAIIVPIEEGIETLREKKTAAIIQSRLETLSKPSMSDEKLRRVFSSRTSAPATGQAGAAGLAERYPGVTFLDPASVIIDEGVTIGRGTVVYPNVQVRENSSIGKNCQLMPGTVITGSIIENGCYIADSKIYDSIVDAAARLVKMNIENSNIGVKTQGAGGRLSNTEVGDNCNLRFGLDAENSMIADYVDTGSKLRSTTLGSGVVSEHSSAAIEGAEFPYFYPVMEVVENGKTIGKTLYNIPNLTNIGAGTKISGKSTIHTGFTAINSRLHNVTVHFAGFVKGEVSDETVLPFSFVQGAKDEDGNVILRREIGWAFKEKPRMLDNFIKKTKALLPEGRKDEVYELVQGSIRLGIEFIHDEIDKLDAGKSSQYAKEQLEQDKKIYEEALQDPRWQAPKDKTIAKAEKVQAVEEIMPPQAPKTLAQMGTVYLNERWPGVTFENPESTVIDEDVQIEPGTLIRPTVIGPNTILRAGTKIGAGSVISDSIIEGAIVGKGATINNSIITTVEKAVGWAFIEHATAEEEPFEPLRQFKVAVRQTEIGDNATLRDMIVANAKIEPWTFAEGGKIEHSEIGEDSELLNGANIIISSIGPHSKITNAEVSKSWLGKGATVEGKDKQPYISVIAPDKFIIANPQGGLEILELPNPISAPDANIYANYGGELGETGSSLKGTAFNFAAFVEREANIINRYGHPDIGLPDLLTQGDVTVLFPFCHVSNEVHGIIPPGTIANGLSPERNHQIGAVFKKKPHLIREKVEQIAALLPNGQKDRADDLVEGSLRVGLWLLENENSAIRQRYTTEKRERGIALYKEQLESGKWKMQNGEWVNPLAAASAVGVDLDDIKGRIIGTDGLRGKVMSDEEVEVFLETLRQKGELGQDETVDDIDLLLKYGILTDRLAYYHGQAYAMTFETSIPFMAGGDNRPSTKKIIENLSEGIRSQGGNVALLEPIITTPALGFLSSHKKYNNIGVVISGSHLLAEENGIKGLLNGRKLLEEDTLKLERNTYLIAKDIVKLPDKTSTGRKEVIDDAEQAYGEYIKYVVDRIQDEFGEKPFAGKTVVLDLANGAATNFAPIIFYELGARVFTINGSFIDGRLINLQDNGATDEEGKTLTSGALNTSRLREEVLRLKADIGVGFDGDADRALFSDEKGKEVDGDGSLGAIALCLKERGALTHNGVVITTMATLGLRKTLERAEINTVLTKVGDRHVSDKMDSNGYVAGGEQSGHTIFRDYQTAGDGVVTACVLLGNAVRKGVGVSELTDQISKTEPYLKKNISAPSPDIANRLIKELNENNRGQNGFYDAIIKIVEEGFISNGMAARYTVSKSNEGYVAANELYIQLWDADNNIKAWISFRQSGTEPKNIRIFLNVDADKETAEQVHRQLIQLTEREIQDISMQPDATAAAGGAATLPLKKEVKSLPMTREEALRIDLRDVTKFITVGETSICLPSNNVPQQVSYNNLGHIFEQINATLALHNEKILVWEGNGGVIHFDNVTDASAAGIGGKITSKEIGERLSKATRELEIAQERLLIVKPTGNKENIAAAQRHLDRWDARVRELKIELDISLGVARNRPNRDDFGEWTAPAAGTTVTLPEAALIIGPDGLQRIEAIAALVPSYGRDNIFEADSEAAATGMLDGIRKTHSIALVVNATGNALTAALASGIGPAKVINLSPDENAETALEDV